MDVDHTGGYIFSDVSDMCPSQVKIWKLAQDGFPVDETVRITTSF